MDKLRQINKNRTANQILVDMFKKEYREEHFKTISASTLRYRLKKAIENNSFDPTTIQSNDLFSDNQSIITSDTQSVNTTDLESKLEQHRDENKDKIERVLSYQLSQAMNLNDKTNANTDSKLHFSIYTIELMEFLAPIKTGQIQNMSLEHFAEKFNLKVYQSNERNFTLFNSIIVYLRLFRGVKCDLNVIQSLLLKVDSTIVQELSSLEYFDYQQKVRVYFETGQEQNIEWIKFLPHALDMNFYCIDSISSEFIMIDHHGIAENNESIILKQFTIELDNEPYRLIYDLYIPSDIELPEPMITNEEELSEHDQNEKVQAKITKKDIRRKIFVIDDEYLDQSNSGITYSNEQSNDSKTSSRHSRRRRRPLTYQYQVKKKKESRSNSAQSKTNTNESRENFTLKQVVDDDFMTIPGSFTNVLKQNEELLLQRQNRPETYQRAILNRDQEISVIEKNCIGSLGGIVTKKSKKIVKYQFMCEFCKALYFRAELNKNNKFTLCCMEGKISLPFLPEYPAELKQLLYPDANSKEQKQKSTEFLINVRAFNAAVSFGAVSARLDPNSNTVRNFVYKIQGSLYHSIPPALVENNQNFHMQGGQYYILDTDQANEQRVQNHPYLNPTVILCPFLCLFV